MVGLELYPPQIMGGHYRLYPLVHPLSQKGQIQALPDFVNKQLLEQSHTKFVCVFSVWAVFMLQRQRKMAVTETCLRFKKPKYLLSDPVKKNFADPCY